MPQVFVNGQHVGGSDGLYLVLVNSVFSSCFVFLLSLVFLACAISFIFFEFIRYAESYGERAASQNSWQKLTITLLKRRSITKFDEFVVQTAMIFSKFYYEVAKHDSLFLCTLLMNNLCFTWQALM